MEGEKMNISEVAETVVRQIIKSGRDVKVVVHDNNEYFGRCVEISGFTTENKQDTDISDEDISEGDIPCEYCEYRYTDETEYPCSRCYNNALDLFERRHDEKTD